MTQAILGKPKPWLMLRNGSRSLDINQAASGLFICSSAKSLRSGKLDSRTTPSKTLSNFIGLPGPSRNTSSKPIKLISRNTAALSETTNLKNSALCSRKFKKLSSKKVHNNIFKTSLTDSSFHRTTQNISGIVR